MFYDANIKGPFKVPGYHDPDDKRLMGIIFRPEVWQTNTVYYRNDSDNYDVVIPTVFTGQYHRVKNPGKSGAIEPTTWGTAPGDETDDGSSGLVWEAVNYNLMPPTETITAFTVSATTGVTISNDSFTDTSIQFMIDPFTAVLTTFDVTCHLTKSNTEEFDVTLRFKVHER